MTGSFAKNRENDFARYANLGGKDNLKKGELDYLVRACGHRHGLSNGDMEQLALLESERLYRVACVLSYGSNPALSAMKSRTRSHKRTIAAMTDIDRFSRIEPRNEATLNEAGEEELWFSCVYTVKIPYDLRLLGGYPATIRTPSRYHGSLNPAEYTFGNVTQAVTDNGASQTFTLVSYNQKPIKEFIHEPFRMLAQAIINARISSNLVGIFDGKPLFETERDIDRLWQTLAELAEEQAPGVCPVCGKIIDRRRGKSGGHPPVACKAHINKFHNELKKYVKEESADHDPEDMIYADRREAAIRALRWKEKPELNERPLYFPETGSLC